MCSSKIVWYIHMPARNGIYRYQTPQLYFAFYGNFISTAINPFVIHCSVPYHFIEQHKKLRTDLFHSGHDIICVTGCGPNPTASLSPIPPLLSKMTPRASGTAKVYDFQNEEYTDHDSTENVIF